MYTVVVHNQVNILTGRAGCIDDRENLEELHAVVVILELADNPVVGHIQRHKPRSRAVALTGMRVWCRLAEGQPQTQPSAAEGQDWTLLAQARHKRTIRGAR